MKKVFRILVITVLAVWQLPQLVLGELIYWFHLVFLRSRFVYTGECYLHLGNSTEVEARYIHLNLKDKNSRNYTGFCMGFRIFVYQNSYNHDEVLKHEMGHSMQSIILGPLYLPVVGLHSLLISGVSGNLAAKSWLERWANYYKKYDIEIYH